MRYVPSLLPLVSTVDKEGVMQVAATRTVRPVASPLTPSEVVTQYRRVGVVGGETEDVSAERRAYTDRRYFCRRIDKERDKLLILDSRGERERRRNNRRPADVRTNIDEEI